MEAEVIFQSKASREIDFVRRVPLLLALPLKLTVSHFPKSIFFRPNVKPAMEMRSDRHVTQRSRRVAIVDAPVRQHLGIDCLIFPSATILSIDTKCQSAFQMIETDEFSCDVVSILFWREFTIQWLEPREAFVLCAVRTEHGRIVCGYTCHGKQDEDQDAYFHGCSVFI